MLIQQTDKITQFNMDSEEHSTSSTLINPELEELRRTVPKPPDVAKIAQDMIKKSGSIHASCLFDPIGSVLRKKMCLLLSATKPSTLYCGWEDFGNQLNLDGHLIKCIKYNFNYEDPTSNVLLAYIQRDSASLANIIQAIHDIKRNDIILQIEEDFAEMYKNIVATNFVYNKREYLTPRKIPDCPFIFKDITKMCQRYESEETKLQRIYEEIDGVKRFEVERQKAAAVVTKKTKNYTKIVMLTYTADGNEIVEKLIPKLRQPRDNRRLGVLLLHEQLDKVNINPEQFIFDCFSQVDYVIPVITPEYVKAINSCTNTDDLLHTDNKYVKYIYTLMTTHYVMNGCRNFKVRGLLSDDGVSLVHTHRLMEHPLLQVWFKYNDIDNIIEKLLNGNI